MWLWSIETSAFNSHKPHQYWVLKVPLAFRGFAPNFSLYSLHSHRHSYDRDLSGPGLPLLFGPWTLLDVLITPVVRVPLSPSNLSAIFASWKASIISPTLLPIALIKTAVRLFLDCLQCAHCLVDMSYAIPLPFISKCGIGYVQILPSTPA